MSKTLTSIKKDIVSQIALPKALTIKPNLILLSQAVIIAQANKSRSTGNVKTRSEVSGTGKKPWKQKGTGRARHGSMRSPIWSGGGITFGPSTERNSTRKITRGEYQIALTMIFAQAAQTGKLVSVSGLPHFKKTKEALKWLGHIPSKPKKITFVVDNLDKYRSFKNIPSISLQSANSLEVDRLAHSDLIIAEESYLNAIGQPAAKPVKKVKND